MILILSYFMLLDKCAQQDPSIDNINNLTKTTCKNYHYGEILHISLVSLLQMVRFWWYATESLIASIFLHFLLHKSWNIMYSMSISIRIIPNFLECSWTVIGYLLTLLPVYCRWLFLLISRESRPRINAATMWTWHKKNNSFLLLNFSFQNPYRQYRKPCILNLFAMWNCPYRRVTLSPEPFSWKLAPSFSFFLLCWQQ